LRKQVICSFAGHADRARTTKAAAPSRSPIPSVSRAARRENANIRFILSVLLRTLFAIHRPFFFWKEVKTHPFNPNGEHLETRGPIITSDILSDRDEALGSAVQSGFRRIRSWRVPPNWSRGDWFEELAAIGTAAAWNAVCEFDPERGVPLARFGYCRMMTRCLSRYRKEWRYALHIDASNSPEKESTTFERPELNASFSAKLNETHPSNDDLPGAIGTLPAEQRRLIERLFWEERTETEVADAMGTNQSTINRRKRAILNGLRIKLRDRNEFQRFSA
jgi:RNA polymerase sigma factor (sigma-70 family)